MPFDATHVIPTGWARHHMPVTEGAMGATCRITTGGEGGWTPETGPTPGTTTTLYEGPCRVQALTNNESDRDAADQLVTLTRYLVVLEADSPGIPVGDQGARVTILTIDDNGDAALVGQVLTVEVDAHSSLRWERDLACTLDATNQTGST